MWRGVGPQIADDGSSLGGGAPSIVTVFFGANDAVMPGYGEGRVFHHRISYPEFWVHHSAS